VVLYQGDAFKESIVAYPTSKQNLPPMMVRYLEDKERHPDALLFFQVGDFYELFYDDAVTVAKALNLTLTSRDKNSPDPIPMCGVPISVLDSYVDRLLPLGYSVAVVSQSGSGQGVDRKLERFVTPGMRLFTSVSSDASESLIAAIGIDRSSATAALACTDPQTGTVRIKEGCALTEMPRELATWMVREVVVPRVIDGEKIDRRTSWVRAREGAHASVAVRFRSESATGYEGNQGLLREAQGEFHALSPAAKRATRLLLSYIDEISLGSPLPVQRIVLDQGSGVVTIDAATRRNLELVQNTKDGSSANTLYGFLNTTQTPGGARLLRSWIVSPLIDPQAIVARQDAVGELVEYYQQVGVNLGGLSDLERLAARVQLGVASPKDVGAIRDTLERVPALQDLLAHCQAGPLKDAVDALAAPFELRSLLMNSLVDSPPHVVHEGGYIRDGFDAELDSIRAIQRDADQWRAAFEAQERKASGITSLKVRSNNVIGYFIEVPSAHSSKVPERYQRRQSTANAERFTTPELKQYEGDVVTALGRQIRREQGLFAEVKTKTLQHVEVLRTIARGMAALDALAALACAAVKYQWTRPRITAGTELVIEQGRHPIIEELLGGSFIPNSVEFGEQSPRCFIVTGPNMGGKSTYLRQIALIAILAQVGSYVPAQRATVGVVDRVFARLGAADDLHEGESTFMVEMREAAHILTHATERSLVVIDELGRGTATTDGQSLAQAVLEQLALTLGCRTLFATHYHEITVLEGCSSRIQNLSVGSIEEEGRVVFTHAIQRGPAPRSYGLEVAKLSGLPDSVLQRATEILQSQTAKRGNLAVTTAQASLFPSALVVPKRDLQAEKIRDVVRDMDVDSLSPRQALETLYQLKGQVVAKV
jgi:DNA mismatch repair protein MutS